MSADPPSRHARGPPWKTAAHRSPTESSVALCSWTDWSPTSAQRRART
ncbi:MULTISPECIES: hypothetical protein [unclassified Nocardioides]|nr:MULTISPECIES: hypothetical protein [unclassified Nocardioides]